MEGEGGCLSTTLMDHQERDLAISLEQAIRNYWEEKRKHRQMLKDNVDTSTKGKESVGCDVDLNMTENGSNETRII